MSGDSAADLVARIDALLPQTQCTRCGYPACRPYAEAIANERVAINRCPPGGRDTIAALAALTGQEPLPLDPAHGIEGPARVAVIVESRCIGCARCLPPCPVDAIVGAAKFMHTVLAERCTGCELCIAACPVDCIEMHESTAHADTSDPKTLNRARYTAHRQREERQSALRQLELAAKKTAAAARAVSRPTAPHEP
jgi:electron transport complex protein RnfB